MATEEDGEELVCINNNIEINDVVQQQTSEEDGEEVVGSTKYLKHMSQRIRIKFNNSFRKVFEVPAPLCVHVGKCDHHNDLPDAIKYLRFSNPNILVVCSDAKARLKKGNFKWSSTFKKQENAKEFWQKIIRKIQHDEEDRQMH